MLGKNDPGKVHLTIEALDLDVRGIGDVGGDERLHHPRLHQGIRVRARYSAAQGGRYRHHRQKAFSATHGATLQRNATVGAR